MLRRILFFMLLGCLLLMLPLAAGAEGTLIDEEDPWEEGDAYEGYTDVYDHEDYAMEVMRGVVLDVENNENPQERDYVLLEQVARIEILSGSLKGQEFSITNDLLGHPLYDITLESGQQFYFMAEFLGDELLEININERIRDRYSYYLVAFFVLLMLVIGRVKGLKALLSLLLTAVLIIYFFLPQLSRGQSPILLAIILAACVTVFTLGIIGGLNNKSLAAILGTVGGILIAGFLALFVGELAQLTGFSTQEAQMLQYSDSKITNIRGILFAGILIGSLGAIMDVAMSISSALNEMVCLDASISRKRLIQAGMNVGRDIMGTMSNTLILAYTGSAIPLMLLFYIYDTPMLSIMNMDMIATEIVRAISGTIGLIVAIPLTAVLAGFLMTKREAQKEKAS